MIYLIRTFGRNKTSTSLKVGFSDDIKKRLSTYKTQNPFFEFITSREGSLLDETRIHCYLKLLNLKEKFLNEWFRDCDEVLQNFHKNYEKMNRLIWRFRNKIFKTSDLENKDSIKNKLYEELRLIYSFNLKKDTEIDYQWRQINNKNIIKNWKDKLYNNYEF